MYFSEFESYGSALEEASGVVIEVKMINGEKHTSSSVPISALPSLIADLEEFYGGKAMLMLWNKDSQTLASFAYEKVESVKIVMIKKRS